MAANTRSPDEREAHLDRLAALVVRGRSQAEIAREFNISQQQVSYDLHDLRSRWRDSAQRTLSDEVARLDALEVEAWKAWERSQRPLRSTRSRSSSRALPGADTDPSFTETLEEDRDGNPRFLEVLFSTFEARRRLLGRAPHPAASQGELLLHALDLLRSVSGDAPVEAVLEEPPPG